MGSLPTLSDDNIADIISRLPAKIVGRCRCFSKFLRSRLSERIFIGAHLEHSRKLRQESLIVYSREEYSLLVVCVYDALLLFGVNRIPANDLSFPGHDDSWRKVYGSCDGLVMAKDLEKKNFLLNPITREIREVPPLPVLPDHKYYMFGLGYDSGSKDYKVVALSCHKKDDKFEVEGDNYPDVEIFVDVWFLKSASWRRVECSLKVYYVGGRMGQFVNGHIHWLANRVDDAKTVILAFNLENGKCHEVSVPSSFTAGPRFNHGYHGVCDGCLCIFNGTNLWLRRENSSGGVEGSWTNIPIRVPGHFPINVLSHEELLMWISEGWAIHNYKLGICQDLLIVSSTGGQCTIETFVESLISPYGFNY